MSKPYSKLFLEPSMRYRICCSITVGAGGYIYSSIRKKELFELRYGKGVTVPKELHIAQTVGWSLAGLAMPTISIAAFSTVITSYGLFRTLDAYDKWKKQVTEDHIKRLKQE